MPKTLTISKATAKAILWEDQHEYTLITSTYNGKSRWSTHHTMVFSDKEGTLWGATYSQGTSESQDEQAFEYAEDQVIFVEHVKKAAAKITYVPAE